MTPTQSALIVAVPAAEPAVAGLRARYDRAASWGVPAHITVLFPFLAPALIDDAVLATTFEAVASVPRFELTLRRTAWFGDKVLWLAPEPAEPLRALTTAVWQRFPQTPPYEGAFGDVVPHLTVADGHPREVLAQVEHAVAAHLPIRQSVETVRLITGRREAGGTWHTVAELPLGR